jgi:hypothetical protein
MHNEQVTVITHDQADEFAIDVHCECGNNFAEGTVVDFRRCQERARLTRRDMLLILLYLSALTLPWSPRRKRRTSLSQHARLLSLPIPRRVSQQSEDDERAFCPPASIVSASSKELR